MLMCCCSTGGDCCANRYGYCDDGTTAGGPLDVLYLTATLRKEFQTFNGTDIGSFITHTGTMRRRSMTYYTDCAGGPDIDSAETSCLWLSDETFTVRSGDYKWNKCPTDISSPYECMDPDTPVRLFFLTSSNIITSFTNDDGCHTDTDYGYDIPGDCYAGYLRPNCDVSNCLYDATTGGSGGGIGSSAEKKGKIMINQAKLQFVSCNPLYAFATKACSGWLCGSVGLYGRDDYVSYVLTE